MPVSRSKTKKPVAAPPESSGGDLESLLDAVIKTVPSNEYRASSVPSSKPFDKIMALKGDQAGDLIALIASRMLLINRAHEAALKNAGDSPHWSGPWQKNKGMAHSLILQRVLMRKVVLTEQQLGPVVGLIEESVLLWSQSGMVNTVIRAVETKQLSKAMLGRVHAAIARVAEFRDGRVLSAKVLAALRDAGALGADLPQHGPAEKLTRWDKALFARANSRVQWSPRLADLLLDALNTPAADDAEGAVSFDAARPELRSRSAAIKQINAMLADAPARYVEYGDADCTRDATVATLTRLDGAGLAVCASALTALALRPIKFDFEGARAQRFHNGVMGLLYAVRIGLSKSTSIPGEDLAELCDALSRLRPPEYVYAKWDDLAASVARLAKGTFADSSDADATLKVLRFRERIARGDEGHDRAALPVLDAALGIGVGFAVDLGEPWSDRMYADLADMRAKERRAWLAFLALCQRATGSKPAAKWLKQAAESVAEIGRDAFIRGLAQWFPLVGKPRPKMPGGKIEGRDSSVPSERAADVLRAMAWAAAPFDTETIARALGDLAMACFKMVPGVGARCIKPGTAAVWALSQMKGPHALAQLSRIRQLVKFGTAKKVLDTTLEHMAADLGITPDELHELAAPDFGLSSEGTLVEEAGEFTIELRVQPEGAEIRVLDQSGRERKTIPDSVKKDHAEPLKALKQTAADIDQMLAAQKARIERLYHEQRSWPLASWKSRYVEHPLVGTIARRLIWNFTASGKPIEAMWKEDHFIGSSGEPVLIKDDSTVSLWHPALAAASSVAAWRALLESGAVRQPFKQAHREVYLLTDAERRTRTYSNRFAGHIVRQSQMNVLCQQRGWKHSLFVMDSGDSPSLALARQGVGVRFEVQPIGEEYYGNAGAYAFLQTDRVHFAPLGENDPIELSRVDPLILSEVLRDVDLFIAICSIGNDPNWADRGADGFGNAYWREYSFGDLTTFGKSRKEFLTRLLPRLKIAPVCTLGDKFLTVRGKLRTYKIHLCSGNILMEPNDQYLCIVPSSKDERGTSASGVFLPFEGDRTLSIILSKAFMLAEDDKIQDTSITRQIKGA